MGGGRLGNLGVNRR